MKLIGAILFILVVTGNLSIFWPEAFAQGVRVHKKKKVKFRTHTQFDFNAQSVEGKVRAPEIFYIFQRRKYSAHQVIGVVKDFKGHRTPTMEFMKETLGP